GRAEASISVVGDEAVAFRQQVQPTADLEVERAELLDTQGVELVDVVVMPLRGDAAAIGAMRLAGIEGDGPDGEGIPWDERVPAQGRGCRRAPATTSSCCSAASARPASSAWSTGPAVHGTPRRGSSSSSSPGPAPDDGAPARLRRCHP